MQRLSMGSPGAKAPFAGDEAEEKAAKPAPPGPDKSIHLVPLLTLFCFLVLFLLSRDPSLAVETAAAIGRGGGGGGGAVIRSSRRLKEDVGLLRSGSWARRRGAGGGDGRGGGAGAGVGGV